MLSKRAILVPLLLVCVACARPEQRPSVIVISIDTLRADHVSPRSHAAHRCAGARGDRVSECVVAFAADVAFASSVFTGLLPPEHGVRDNAGYRFDASAHPTLAAVLRANGYRTGAAVSAYVLRGGDGGGGGVR